jgi:ABC-type nitrate/sulfonate/bicarbonate transport system permease component
MQKIRHIYLRHEPFFLGMLMIGALLLVWEGLSRGWWADLLRPLIGESAAHLRIRDIFISSPVKILSNAWNLFFVTGEIWPHIAVSAVEVIVGLSISILIAIPSGLIVGRYSVLTYAVEPLIAGLNATPQVVFIPLFILWFGTGYLTRVFIICFLTFIPIFISALSAMRTLDVRLLRVAHSFAASEFFIFRSIIVPSAVPFLITGLRLAIGRAMIGVVVGELFGSPLGIGLLINRAGSTFQTATVFVGVFTIVMAGVGLSWILRHVELHYVKWR